MTKSLLLAFALFNVQMLCLARDDEHAVWLRARYPGRAVGLISQQGQLGLTYFTNNYDVIWSLYTDGAQLRLYLEGQ